MMEIQYTKPEHTSLGNLIFLTSIDITNGNKICNYVFNRCNEFLMLHIKQTDNAPKSTKRLDHRVLRKTSRLTENDKFLVQSTMKTCSSTTDNTHLQSLPAS